MQARCLFVHTAAAADLSCHAAMPRCCHLPVFHIVSFFFRLLLQTLFMMPAAMLARKPAAVCHEEDLAYASMLVPGEC